MLLTTVLSSHHLTCLANWSRAVFVSQTSSFLSDVDAMRENSVTNKAEVDLRGYRDHNPE